MNKDQIMQILMKSRTMTRLPSGIKSYPGRLTGIMVVDIEKAAENILNELTNSKNKKTA